MTIPICNQTTNELDKIAIKYKADKSTECHGLTIWYDFFLKHLRTEPIRLLELGLGHGTSAKTWREYFPNATIVMGDCNKEYVDKTPEGCIGVLCDQDFQETMIKLCADYGPFDIVIDDAGHQMFQQQRTFVNIFPHVNPNGIYIIEDLFTSFLLTSMKEFGEISTVDFLCSMVDSVMWNGLSNCEQKTKLLEKYSITKTMKLIDAMFFIYNAAIIIRSGTTP